MAVFTPTAQARACDRRACVPDPWASPRSTRPGTHHGTPVVHVKSSSVAASNLGPCAVSAGSVSGDERVNRFSSSTMRFCASAIAGDRQDCLMSASEATDAMRASRSTWSLAAAASPHEARAAQLDAPTHDAPQFPRGTRSPTKGSGISSSRNGRVPDTRRLTLVVASCNARGVVGVIGRERTPGRGFRPRRENRAQTRGSVSNSPARFIACRHRGDNMRNSGLTVSRHVLGAFGVVTLAFAGIGVFAGTGQAASPTLAVNPQTGLSDGQSVTVTGTDVGAFPIVAVVECGNADSNGTPLPGTAPTPADCYGAESVGTGTLLVIPDAPAPPRRRTQFTITASAPTTAVASTTATSTA
jgi:hypothetical protein